MSKPGSNEVVIIGAGAAGILAAWSASVHGAKVLVLEKTARIGTKILISGGGKCNITHDGPLEEVLRAFRPNEARFIRPSCYQFKPQQMVELLTGRGLKVYTRPDGRIFPVDQTAKDVVAILEELLSEHGVEVRKNTKVESILVKDGAVCGVQTELGEIPCSRVILCTGGSSYPNSGTTGDGYTWAKALGHTVVPIRAALAPMYLTMPFESPSGVSFRGCVLKARAGGKLIAKWQGDLLFTHHGISGPCALGISREVTEAMGTHPVQLEIDIIPEETFESQSTYWIDAARNHPNALVSTKLTPMMPARLADLLVSTLHGDDRLLLRELDKKRRNRLIELLKGWPIGTVRAVPMEKGEVVAGGVSLDEVDPQTLRSRLVRGLWLAGEVLDIAGPVGGYNLQAAWATGFVAGRNAAESNSPH